MEHKRIKLYIVPHTHIDLEWFWSFDTTKKMVRSIFNENLLKIMQRDDKMTFAQDQIPIFETMIENCTPEDKEFLLSKVREGKFEPVGGMYVQPEMLEPCGEALIKQIQIGQGWLKETFGKRATCAWNTDTFGQISQLPQILKKSGFESFVFMRDIAVEDNPDTFPTEFYFEAPDGSKILTHWLANTYVLCENENTEVLLKLANIEVTKESMKKDFQKLFSAFGNADSLQHKTGVALLLWGDDIYTQKIDSEGIIHFILEAARIAEMDIIREDIVIAGPSGFFEKLEEKSDELQTMKSDFNPALYRQDLRGSYVSRIKLKKLNRKAEIALLSLQSLMAVLDVQNTDSTITDCMWKDVLFNQSHDTMGGSCIDEVYVTACEKYESVIEKVKQMKCEIFKSENTDQNTITVYNPTPFTRTEFAKVTVSGIDGHAHSIRNESKKEVLSNTIVCKNTEIEFLVRDIAPFGFATFTVEKKEEADNINGIGNFMENEYYKIAINETNGCVESIIDKLTNTELVDVMANELIAIEEDEPDMEGELKLSNRIHRESRVRAIKIEVENSKVSQRAIVRKSFMGFEVTKVIELKTGQRRIEFEVEIQDYTGENLMLMVDFGINIKNAASIYETPFAIERRGKGFYCAQNWAALSDGTNSVSLMNKGTAGYWVKEGHMEIALLRGYKNYTRYADFGLQKGISDFNDGKTHTDLASEKGYHKFQYAFTSGREETAYFAKQGILYNYEMDTFAGGKTENKSMDIRNISSTFIITSFKQNAEKEYLVRGYNACEIETEISMDFAKEIDYAYETDLLDIKTKKLLHDRDRIKLIARPFEIITVCVGFAKQKQDSKNQSIDSF